MPSPRLAAFFVLGQRTGGINNGPIVPGENLFSASFSLIFFCCFSRAALSLWIRGVEEEAEIIKHRQYRLELFLFFSKKNDALWGREGPEKADENQHNKAPTDALLSSNENQTEINFNERDFIFNTWD